MNKQEDYIKTYNKALDIISYREHFSLELEKKLVNKGFEREVVLAVIEEFVDKSYIDDLRAARLYLSEKKYKYGNSRLRAMLYDKGLKSEDVEIVVEEVDVSDRDKLRSIIEDKKVELGLKPPYTEREIAKLARFADSRGFRAGLIYDIIADLRRER